jgi:starch phosphorylase
MMLERVRELVANGIKYEDAVARVRANSVFTTHTPVPAGHDVFPAQLVDRYLGGYWKGLGIDRQTFYALGQAGGNDQGFNMTVLALKMAEQRTAVSQIHGAVSRAMWHGFWPNVKEEEVPIGHITNGVHVPTWAAPELDAVFSQHLGKDFLAGCSGAEYKDRVFNIPDEDLWEAHVSLKRKLVHIILERAQEHWASANATAEQTLAMGALLDSDALTIGFARRFTEYKRPALIFRDIERLIKIVSDPWQPVQIVFAGKSHPADFPSKYLIHQVYNLAKERRFQGRIAFLEDYDMHLAHYLVQGVDVWLNNPRRRQEASGTSGMKAAVNGIPHLSVRDGWWNEGYNGSNGWVIGEGVNTTDPEEEDRLDSASLYDLLEKEVVPLFYDRDRNNVPHGWMQMFKETVSSITPFFSTARMMKEYIERMYLPAARSVEKRGQ